MRGIFVICFFYVIIEKYHVNVVFDATCLCLVHDDVIKWKHFPRYWPFMRGIHRSAVNSPQKGQWCGALMFSLICARINDWVSNREAGDLRCHRSRYDVIVMLHRGEPGVQRALDAWLGSVQILTVPYPVGARWWATWYGLTLIPAWISNYMNYKMWDEITYPFPNFNGATVEVWEWISYFIPHFTGHVITYPYWD